MDKYLILRETAQLRPQRRPLKLNRVCLTFAPTAVPISISPRDEIMNAACDAWWDNRLAGNEDYTPPWISLPDELNSARNKFVRKVNFENRSPRENEEDL
jgi:hypothetical protein